jgi:hypothetical protein
VLPQLRRYTRLILMRKISLFVACSKLDHHHLSPPKYQKPNYTRRLLESQMVGKAYARSCIPLIAWKNTPNEDGVGRQRYATGRFGHTETRRRSEKNVQRSLGKSDGPKVEVEGVRLGAHVEGQDKGLIAL